METHKDTGWDQGITEGIYMILNEELDGHWEKT